MLRHHSIVLVPLHYDDDIVACDTLLDDIDVFAQVLYSICSAYEYQGKYTEVANVLENSLKLRQTNLVDMDCLDSNKVRIRLGQMYLVMKNGSKALHHFNIAKEVQNRASNTFIYKCSNCESSRAYTERYKYTLVGTSVLLNVALMLSLLVLNLFMMSSELFIE